MGVRERRDREREARRQAILDAARELFVSEGYEHVSIRKIARRVELAGSAIYGYFKGKEDIFFALAENGFRLFDRAMRSVEAVDDPLEMLKRRAWRYYHFSRTQPQYFALMFVERSVPRISRDWERFAFLRQTWNETAAFVARCVELGVFPPSTDPGAAFHIIATAMHGAAVIRLGDRFSPGAAVDALARDVLETTIAGLCQGVPTTFRGSPHGTHPVPAHSSSAAGTLGDRPARPRERRSARRAPDAGARSGEGPRPTQEDHRRPR
jgi:AcrR family transcriptional regulator